MTMGQMKLVMALPMMLAPLLSTADEAEWLVAPYIWLSDITLDQTSGVSGGISASDLLDKSDSVGMIRMETARNRWGFTLDYLWLGVSEDATISLPVPIGGVNLRAELDISIVEIGGFFRPSGNDNGVNYLFGLRNMNIDKTLLVTPPGGGPTQRFDGDPDFTDAFAGVRYLHRFSDDWDLNLRGDYGFGDSEGTLNLLATVGYRFNRTFAVNLGYRHLAIEFEENVDSAVETTDIEMSGPLIGFLFRF